MPRNPPSSSESKPNKNRVKPQTAAGKPSKPRGNHAQLSVAIFSLTFVSLLFSAGSAQAAIVHDFESTPTKAISEHAPTCTGPGSVTGALGEVNAMTIDPQEPVGGSSHLWLAETLAEGSKERVDELNASTGACEQQLEAASLSQPIRGVAVGHATGEREVYVGAHEDRTTKTEDVVGVFDPSGALQSVWTGKATPGGSFSHLSSGGGTHVLDIAVDGSTNAATAGDVYVAVEGFEQNHGAVYAFKPEAVLKGAEPASVLAALTGTCETPGEVATGLLACAASSSHAIVPFKGLVAGVAVDPANGDLIVADDGIEGSLPVIDVFKPEGLDEYVFVRQITEVEGHSFTAFSGVSAGGGEGNGDIYVADDAPSGPVVYQFGAEGAYLGKLTGPPSGPFLHIDSVAVDPANGDVSVGDQRGAQGEPAVVDVFGPNLVVPNVVTEPASGETPRSATLDGKVSALEAQTSEAAECQFAWGTTEALLGNTAPCEQSPVKGEETAVTAKVTKLQPDTTYYYQLQAKNTKGTNTNGAILHFTTTGPGILSTSVFKVASTSATLDATLEPHGVSTSYRFEYDTTPYAPEEAPHGTAVPAAAEAIGSAPGEVKVEQHIQGLAAGRTYYYRVVTIAGEEFDGEGHSFTTQGAGEFVLPDHRQYEMVSPPNKDGALLDGIDQAGTSDGTVIQAAADGHALTYVATFPTEPEPVGDTLETQVFSARGAAGWSTRDLTVPHAGATDGNVGLGNEYRFFSTDLSSAIVQPWGAFAACSVEGASRPCLSQAASEQTAFLNDLGARTFTPLVTGCPTAPVECGPAVAENADIAPGTVFGVAAIGGSGCPPSPLCGPQFLAGTPDASHVVLSSQAPLVGSAPPESLYEWNATAAAGQRLVLVSVLPEPEGGMPASAASLGNGSLGMRGAISGDGSRVFFSAHGALYMRDVAAGKTIRLDTGALAGSPSAEFQSATSDGSRVLFSDKQRLTADSGATSGKKDLYECVISETVPGEPACALTDLTPRNGEGESAGVQGGVIGSSVDGSWVYFVADGVLENGGVPVAGAVHGDCSPSTSGSLGAVCNLYVRHGGVTRLVAVLSGKDYPDWAGGGPGNELEGLTAHVAGGGGWLEFMSVRSLTGYDNEDISSRRVGERLDEEVYSYDAGSGRVVCVSCEPSGGRPAGVEYGPGGANVRLVGGNEVWSATTVLGGDVPGWTPYENRAALYQSRIVSDDGRVFFNARSPLVSNDVNNQWDVYEYEPVGLGACTKETASGSTEYVPAENGCVGLISNGESKDESAFLDASATGGKTSEGAEGGGDVFFLTTSQLSTQDVDDAYDVYDAHECMSESPCIQPATSPPPCTTEASCKASSTPQPGIYGPPASATFSGHGNLTPESCSSLSSSSSSGSAGPGSSSSSSTGSGSSSSCGSKPPPGPICSSSLGAPSSKCSKKQNLNKALATCKRKYAHSKKKRSSCEATSRHKYAARKAGKSSAKNSTRGSR